MGVLLRTAIAHARCCLRKAKLKRGLQILLDSRSPSKERWWGNFRQKRPLRNVALEHRFFHRRRRCLLLMRTWSALGSTPRVEDSLTIVRQQWMVQLWKPLTRERLIRLLGVLHCDLRCVNIWRTRRHFRRRQGEDHLLRGVSTPMRTQLPMRALRLPGFLSRRQLPGLGHQNLHHIQIAHRARVQGRSLGGVRQLDQ